jgi:transcriptional regulator with XRE-family HTH domain
MEYAIGQRLAAFRKKYGVVMPAIAKATGITKENLYKWEKGTKPSNFNDYRALDEYIRTMEEKGGPPSTGRRRGRSGIPDGALVDREDTLTIPNVQLVVHFTEGSMIPLYKPGCRLCLRRVPHPRSLVWGNVYYFVDLNDKGILRRVYATADKETIRLLSYDPEEYPPIMRQYNELNAVYEVIGLLFI